MRQRLLRFLKISDRPDPPPGAGPTLATFRASRRYFHYRVLAWIPKQVGAFLGLVASLAFFGAIDQPFVRFEVWSRVLEFLERLRFNIGPWAVDPTTAFYFFEALAVVAFVAQLIFTGLLLKLSWELRWYMVGDECLRLREGLWFVREQTMTIANIQNMVVRQGPIQKLFGIADLEVHTAGGGAPAGDADESEGDKDLHVGRFRGLDDARGLRDRIRARLSLSKGAGLGDADELHEEAPGGGTEGSGEELLPAAQELLEEVRALRTAMTAAQAAMR